MEFITKLTDLTDKWFYKLIKDGKFPKPIKLGRSSRWLESEVEAWLQQRITDSGADAMQASKIPPRWICDKCRRQFCGVKLCPFCYRIALPSATAFC
jgi:predicted DNA-binding transcriptional regulator AlpA